MVFSGNCIAFFANRAVKYFLCDVQINDGKGTIFKENKLIFMYLNYFNDFFQTSIVVSCVVGAYVFTAPVDHYIGGNLKYIFLNVMRRATDSEFSTAIIQPPYQILGE